MAASDRPDDKKADNLDAGQDATADVTQDPALETALSAKRVPGRKGSLKPVFGRASASKVSPMPDQRRVFAMYGGMPPITLLVSRFLREHEESGIERRAGALLRELDQSSAREDVYARMEDLCEKGSKLAAYVLAVAQMTGRHGERDEDAATRVLLDLCQQDFRPAFAQLAGLLTPRDLSLPKGQALWPAILKGNGMGVVHCLHLSALAWTRGWIAPTPEEFTTIIFGLREAARSGSWDCLTALLGLLERIPVGIVPGEIIDHALELARMAALDGMPEAMTAYGRILVRSPLVVPEPKEGLFWLKKAWKAGSLDGGVQYAGAVMQQHPANASAMEEARHVLEECCEQICPDAMALLGQMDVFDTDDNVHYAALDLMRHAATLGSSDRYVDTLWMTLLGNLEYPEEVADCERRLKELARDHNDANARFRLAQFDLVIRRKPAPKEKSPIERLEELADEGCAKACTLLAMTYSFGFHGIARDGAKATRWLGEAVRRHEPRAHALIAYGALKDAADRSLEEKKARYAELAALVDWLAYPREDDMALAMLAVRNGLLDDPKADDFLATLGKEEAETFTRNIARMIEEAVWGAKGSGDLATILVVCQAFGEARACSLHERIAEAVLDDWQLPRAKGLPACRSVANLCLSLMVRLGEVELLGAPRATPSKRK